MKIIFLHGLESTPETSETAKLIKDNFDNVVVPDYKPSKNSYGVIKDYFESTLKNEDDDIVIGISLGGFWALKMTEFTNIKRVIMINPAILKSAERYGTIIDTPSDVMGKMILNMDDDIVDNEQNYEIYRNKFSITKFATGGHRAENKEEIIEEIKKSVNILSLWTP